MLVAVVVVVEEEEEEEEGTRLDQGKAPPWGRMKRKTYLYQCYHLCLCHQRPGGFSTQAAVA
jgi:hypothetical protein